MKKKQIIKDFDEIKNQLSDNDTNIFTMFVNQNNTRKEQYKGMMLNVNKNELIPIINSSFEFILDEIENNDLQDYNFNVIENQTCYILKNDNLFQFNKIIEQISPNSKNLITTHSDFKNFKFFIVQVTKKNKTIYLIKRYPKETKNIEKKFKYTLVGTELKAFKDEIITLQSNIDFAFYDNYFIIINPNAFNSIMQFDEIFTHYIKTNEDKIVKSNLFMNSDQFIEDCTQDKRNTIKLAKIIMNDGFKNVQENRQNLPRILNEYNLNIKLSENGKFCYDNPTQIKEILNIFLEHYVTSALSNNKMIALAIQNYDINSQSK